MKKTLMVLALGLASSTAFADERGQILFKGNINGGTTCPIEIVIPGAGPIGAVDLENYSVKYFATNDTTPDIPFALRVDADDATCTIPPGYTAKVTFDSLNGDAGASDEYYAIHDRSGYYFDGVAKLNRYQNRAEVQLSDGSKTKGDYSNHGVGLSLEAGRHLKLGDGYFVEPYVQLAAMTIKGQSYHLDNGLRASGDDTHSLQGKLGTTAGRTFDYGEGRMIQPYLRAAVAQEFVNGNQVRVNGNSFHNDLAGTRAELGAGIVAAWSQQWQAHAEFDYANGERLEQPWGVSVGVRYNW